MSPYARKLILAAGCLYMATILAVGIAGVAGCAHPSGAQIEKAARDAQVKMNAYCDARAKAIEALGAAGAP